MLSIVLDNMETKGEDRAIFSFRKKFCQILKQQKNLFFAECHSQVESQCAHYAAGVNDVESVNPVVPIATVENTGTYVKGGIDKHVI